jgi:Tfp pilus assembly protein PilN
VRAVNLLPRDEQRARLQSARTSLFVAAGGVVVVTALAMFLASSAAGDAKDSRAELQAVETEIANLPEAAGAVVTSGTIVRERSDRVAALSAALSTRVPFDRLLREISLVLPGDAWLTQLDATAPAPTAPAVAGSAPPPATTTSAGVSIEGATYSHDSVARVLARLSIVPSLENVRLTSSARVEPSKESPNGEGAAKSQGLRKPFVTFIVTASLRTGDGR